MKKSDGLPPGFDRAQHAERLIAKKIKKYCNNNGLSHDALAQKAGVSVEQIENLEHDHGGTTLLHSAWKLAKVLKIKLSDIITEIEGSLPG